ncbi:MAG: hypothetical protein AAGA68_01420 [Pseudomonadota bacterium]
MPTRRKTSTAIKHLAQRLSQPTLPALVVASLGRSGSTLLHEALVDAMAERRFGPLAGPSRRLAKDYVWDLDGATLYRGVVYKTHDFPEALAAQARAVRAMFIFGSAQDAALSVRTCFDRYGPTWIGEHFAHLHADGPYEELLTRDVLRFEEQLRRWASYTDVPVLCLRYETLWDHIAHLREFCGVPVSLPPRRQRERNDAGADTLDAANSVYAPLDRIIDRLPDAFIGGSVEDPQGLWTT